MKSLKYALLFAPVLLVSACGGGSDLEDRLDVADPKVRFVHAVAGGPNVTLSRNDNVQSDATNVPYKAASNYYDVETGSATWRLKTSASATPPNVDLTSIGFDARRGNRYNLVAVPSGSGVELMSIRDPYNKSLVSDRARVRVVNAAPNTTGAVDLYLTQNDTNLANVPANIGGVGQRQAVPGDGQDSQEVQGTNYRIRLTTSGTKTVIFNSNIALDNNTDWLLVAVPDQVLVPNSIKVLAVRVGSDNRAQPTLELTSN